MKILFTALVLVLLFAAPAAANDRAEVRLALTDFGGVHVSKVSCDETRHCIARYAYLDRSARRLGFKRLAVRRCRGWFALSNGHEDLGDGYVWDYVDVETLKEQCWTPAPRYGRSQPQRYQHDTQTFQKGL
jgi:uncharacterized protein (DUF1786 family)